MKSFVVTLKDCNDDIMSVSHIHRGQRGCKQSPGESGKNPAAEGGSQRGDDEERSHSEEI